MIRYTISPDSPAAHIFAVSLEIDHPDPDGQIITLPAWIPGSYMIRDFAKNIVSLSATSGNKAVELVQIDKQSWRVSAVEESLRIDYLVYAWDLSVRAAHLDQTHAYFNGTSVFLKVCGQEDSPAKVVIQAADGMDGWSVATTLKIEKVDQAGYGTYEANNYEDLIDHPVEIGPLTWLDFEAASVPHQMAISGKHYLDQERLKSDLIRICDYHNRFFGLPSPVSRYLFLTMVVGDGYGGLEHKDSCSLLCSRNDLPSKDMDEMTESYRRFLGLCSHEYFHLWNVKRIRPERLKTADLSEEVYTELLWAFEGITSYYDELALTRCGCVTQESYLEMLAQTVTRVMRGPGRHKQSVADSSINAWTKFYKQDENAANAIVSYYAKGALVAFGLDVELRNKSDGRVCLDDLMRKLWVDYGQKDIGVPEEGIKDLAEALCGESLADFFRAYVKGIDELPLQDWFESMGIGMRLRPSLNQKDLGSSRMQQETKPLKHVLGARYQQKGDYIQITSVTEKGAAQKAGLSAGDCIVAVDGLQVKAADLDAFIDRFTPHDVVTLHAFRRDELMTFSFRPQTAKDDTCDLWLLPEDELTDMQKQRRQAWLGQVSD